jgi:hypothetical protein
MVFYMFMDLCLCDVHAHVLVNVQFIIAFNSVSWYLSLPNDDTEAENEEVGESEGKFVIT